jgi:SAM-dependent methyltransferase
MPARQLSVLATAFGLKGNVVENVNQAYRLALAESALIMTLSTWEAVPLSFLNSNACNMGRRKLDKFRDNESSVLVIVSPVRKYSKESGQTGISLYFRNQHPLILELGCGRGEYTVGLARLFPEKNVIGIDIKGSGSGTEARRP